MSALNYLAEQKKQDLLLTHVILPRFLPQENSHHLDEIEQQLLHEMVATVFSLSAQVPIKTIKLFESLQKIHDNMTPCRISSEIRALQPGDSFGLFVRRQRWMFMIHAPLPGKDENAANCEPREVIVATFPANVRPSEIYKHDSDVELSYPFNAITVKFSTMLRSEDFANQLCILYRNSPTETQKTTRNTEKEPKRRDYVCDWLMTLLSHEGSRTATVDEFPVISKKVRDEVLGQSDKSYFRRSYTYMATKALLQHHLTLQLGADTGKLLYKIIMLKFMNKIGGFYLRSKCINLNIDLLSELIAKMARRIEKFHDLIDDDSTNSICMATIYQNTVHEAKDFISQMRSKIDDQIVKTITRVTDLPPLTGLNWAEDIRQEMPKLTEYLRMRMNATDQPNYRSNYRISSYQRFFIDQYPKPDAIDAENDPLGKRVFWIEFENCILDMKINDQRWPVEVLCAWSFKYAKFSQTEYKDNQLFSSRAILVRLKIISMLDHFAVEKHHLLSEHHSGIDPEIFALLLLPCRRDMEIAYDLEKYFNQRNQANPSLIGEQMVASEHSFSSRFVQQNEGMKTVLGEILAADENNIAKKEEEWIKQKENAKRLRVQSANKKCQYLYSSIWKEERHSSSCEKCRLAHEADALKIMQYERLLPENIFKRYAIVFELQIPKAIAYLRDTLYEFTKYCYEHHDSNEIKFTWIADRFEISKHNQSISSRVWLGSLTKFEPGNIRVSNDFDCIVANSNDCIFYGNDVDSQTSDTGQTNKKTLIATFKDDVIKNVCTFQAQAAKYANLQWTLRSTRHTQNCVLAHQFDCPGNLSLQEFINFGSLRADGHRLQLRKLFAMIETDALSFDQDAVLSLVMQSIWECGISGDAAEIRESHIDFDDPKFCIEFIQLLQKFVDHQSGNWTHPNKMIMAVLIAVRAFEINADSLVADEIVGLLNSIRSIILKWIDEIGSAISTMKNPDEKHEREWRLKLIHVGIAGAITFFVHPKHKLFGRIFNFVDDRNKNSTAACLWLQYIITVNTNLLMYTNDVKSLPTNLQMFLRLIESIGVNLAPSITTMIPKHPAAVNDLIRRQWTWRHGIESLQFNETEIHFDSQFPQILPIETMLGSNTTQIVSIDIFSGIFLFDGLPICRLPKEILESAEYRWFFGNVAFEVQPGVQKQYSTVQKYNECTYKFQGINNQILITERNSAGVERNLLHYAKFSDDSPFMLANNYSHWWNKSENSIEFRRRTFGLRHFSKETSIDYRLELDKKELIEIKTQRRLLDIKTMGYRNITQQLARLEHSNFIHVLTSNTENVATVELPRMKLKFKLNTAGKSPEQQHYELESNEFSGMRVSRTQNVGTLYGLTHGLVLESTDDEQKRMLLIPNGEIQCERTDSHVLVQIDTLTQDGLQKPPFLKYEIEKNCRQIKSTDGSFTSWFYLAYLHAITSYGQIEPFTGMTGTERAIQILQSAFSWSASPYEHRAIELLEKIAKLSPLRQINENRQIVKWPEHIQPCAAQDCFVFIARKLFEDSQRMHKFYDKEYIFKKPETDLELNARDHRRCEQLYPNLGVSGVFIERKEPCISLPRPLGSATFSHNTQKLAILYHNQRYHVPSSLNLKDFLLKTQHEPLIGLPVEYSLSTLLNHSNSESLENLWIRLYNAARQNQFNNEQFALILTLCSHRNMEIDPIFAIQAIAANPDEFRKINPPSVSKYKLSDGFGVNDNELSYIFLINYEKPADYYEYDKTTASYLKRIEYDRQRRNLVDQVAEWLNDLWPCDSVDLTGKWYFPQIDFARVNREINDWLSKWYKNWQLEKFIGDVEKKLKSLSASQNALNLPNYSAMTVKPKSWFKFKIDFDDTMELCIQINENDFTDVYANAQNTWRQQQNDSATHGTCYSWWSKIQTILSSNNYFKHLIDAGLYPRIIPSFLLPMLAPERDIDKRLKSLIGAWAMAIVCEQREHRIELLGKQSDQHAAIENETKNKPHVNWKPCERPDWLLFEIEQNLTIREIQIKVAEQMMSGEKHSVMQLNMGEGKTSVILPILAATLADANQICQITVLNSMFPTNLDSLRGNLGGLLNRRIYTFPCRRNMSIDTQTIQQMLEIYEECKKSKGIILTVPEYRLSFELKMYDCMSKEQPNYKLVKCISDALEMIRKNVRNVLDESDAILQPKYQLIYTVGNQSDPYGGALRWSVVQAVLKRVSKHMKNTYTKYNEEKIELIDLTDAEKYRDRDDVFTPFRILDETIFDELKSALIDDFLDRKLDIDFPRMNDTTKSHLKLLLTHQVPHTAAFQVINDFSATEQNTIWILSGLLRFEVLKLALMRRWHVNYGVNPNGHRKMAVPFRAKDVAAEMTEFGHPELAICLTQLSYYYSGLNDDQLLDVFKILENTIDASDIYGNWIKSISTLPDDSPIKLYAKVNLDNPEQRDAVLFPLLRKNMHVIDFWLSNVVFPREMKMFDKKLTCTAWDLCSERIEKLVTGFSGTNDTKNILPLPITQNDLAELQQTNKHMDEMLSREENQYETFTSNINGKKILEWITQRDNPIPVLIDAGALIIELTNEQVAIEWLKLASFERFEAAVYFDSNDILQTIDRDDEVVAYDRSVYRDNLTRCVVFLDDVHTRGTDLKFPQNWRAAVTLSGDITRDKMVQSCMRMRQLGKAQSISFMASFEADLGIRKLCQLSAENKVTNENVIQFIYANSKQFERANMPHWASAGLNYVKKQIGHKLGEKSLDENSMKKLYDWCIENEFLKLEEMYGEKIEALLKDIVELQLNKIATDSQMTPETHQFLTKMKRDMIAKLETHVPNAKKLTHSFDEEQEKELEKELEKEIERPPKQEPAEPKFDLRLEQLLRPCTPCAQDKLIEDMKTDGALMSLPSGLSHTKIAKEYPWIENDVNAWADHLLVTKDFQTVIEISNGTDTCDEYLRPVWWVAQIKNAHINGKSYGLLLSSYECEQLLPTFRQSRVAILKMYRSRLSESHNNLLHVAALQVTAMDKASAQIDIDDEIQFSVFSGSMYFQRREELKTFCNFLGLIPNCNTPTLREAFEQQIIETKGFVPFKNRQHSAEIAECVGKCRFKNNPIDFLIKLIETRYYSLPKAAHVASILNRGIEPQLEHGS